MYKNNRIKNSTRAWVCFPLVFVLKKSLRAGGGGPKLVPNTFRGSGIEGGWSSAALQRPFEPKVPVKRWLAAKLYLLLLLGNSIEPALEFRVAVARLDKVKERAKSE